jgi:hypothetical protein
VSGQFFQNPGYVIVPTVGPWIKKNGPDESVDALLTGTGAVTATVLIETSNFEPSQNPVGILGATISLTGSDAVADGFITQDAKWKYWRARVTAISGTSAQLQVVAGPT